MDSVENDESHVNGEETTPQNDTPDVTETNGGAAAESKVVSVDGLGHDTSKGNEDKKIFVGGIAYDVTNEDLQTYFTQFGEVAQVQVKYDRTTGRSRGFAFVEFATTEACKAALVNREQTIKTKKVEVKPAKSRENKKVFVGGLPAEFPEPDLRKHFEQFGKVEDIEWPFDKQRNARRNFAFIVFEEEEAADRASACPKQTFGDRECDVKKAVPQGKRFAQGMVGGRGGMFGNYRGGYGRGGGFYGNNIWGGAGAMNYGNYGGGWGDWYANAGNFYGSGTNTTGYGSYGGGYYDDYSSAGYGDYWGGSGAGYDSYSQAQATSGASAGGHRTGAASGGRYQQHQQQF